MSLEVAEIEITCSGCGKLISTCGICNCSLSNCGMIYCERLGHFCERCGKNEFGDINE